MTKKEMKNIIFDLLGSILEGTDFRLKKKQDAYIRKIAGGWQMLGLPLWDYSPLFKFSLNICIRLDAVEDITNKFTGTPEKYHSETLTTMTTLEYFIKGPAKFEVVTAQDVESKRALLSSAILERIIPFFDQFQDPQSLDQALNREEQGFDISNYPWKALAMVTLAHLAKNENYDNIVLKYRTQMNLDPSADHPFNKLVDYLKTR